MMSSLNAIDYFNPRSREGSDVYTEQEIACNAYISIHAPARGATEHKLDIYMQLIISIHAPARGAT